MSSQGAFCILRYLSGFFDFVDLCLDMPEGSEDAANDEPEANAK
jgi:hypothetical protein